MGFTLPVLQKCCCCCSLRVGTLVIGYLSMFNSLLYLAAYATAIAFLAKFVQSEKQNPNPQHRPDDLLAQALGAYITWALCILLHIFYFVISLLVVVGVHRNKPHLLVYYVSTVLFMLIIAAALVIVSVVFVGVISSLQLLLSSVIVFYCLLVVRSYYLEMLERNRPKVHEMHTISPQQAPLMA